MEDRLLTIDDLAKYLSVSRRTVYRLIRGEPLPGYRIGGHLRFRRTDVDGWLESKREDSAGEEVGLKPRSTKDPRGGFTLVEMLIVVGIISLLAALAIPNFLDAQVRAKVARAQADMATIAFAIELYAADHGDYPPNDGLYNVTPTQMTTPIAYLNRDRPMDPFATYLEHPVHGREARLYTYARVVSSPWSLPPPPIEGVDHPFFNPGARRKYGEWYQLSIGPDGVYSGMALAIGPWPTYGFDIPYDPTNGTVSFGSIMRTHRSPEVLRPLTEEGSL